METRAARWEWHDDGSSVIGVALHPGHALRSNLMPYILIDEDTRLREEDPYTDVWARTCKSWVIVNRSRFELDLNRPRSDSVYTRPANSWGYQVWRTPLPERLLRQAYAEHTLFYRELDSYLERFSSRHGRFVILDLHSYNHRRSGPEAKPTDPLLAPQLNVGTGYIDRDYWGPVVDAFMAAMSETDYQGGQMDVRENVNFRGRYLAQHVSTKFPKVGCVLALEFKKTFMDEWRGCVMPQALHQVEIGLDGAISEIERVLTSDYCWTRTHAS